MINPRKLVSTGISLVLYFTVCAQEVYIDKPNYCCASCEGRDEVSADLFIRPNDYTYVSPRRCSWNLVAHNNTNYYYFQFQGSESLKHSVSGTEFKGLLCFRESDQVIPFFEVYEVNPEAISWDILLSYYLKRLCEKAPTMTVVQSLQTEMRNAKRFVICRQYKASENGKYDKYTYDIVTCLVTKNNTLKRYKNSTLLDEIPNVNWISYNDERYFVL